MPTIEGKQADLWISNYVSNADIKVADNADHQRERYRTIPRCIAHAFSPQP